MKNIEKKTEEISIGMILNAQGLLTYNAQESINSLRIYELIPTIKYIPVNNPKKEAYAPIK